MESLLASVLLIGFRLLPLLVVAPVFPFNKAPLMVRVVLCFCLATVLSSSATAQVALSDLWSHAGNEIFLGVIFAFGFHAIVAALDMVGKLLDTQMGFTAANIFDPAGDHAGGLLSSLLIMLFGLLLLSRDLHLQLLKGAAVWFHLLPPGVSLWERFDAMVMAGILSRQLMIAFVMVFPVFLGLWLTDIAFAFLSRSMPQANIYFVALPVKIVMGGFLLILTLPMMSEGLVRMFSEALRPIGLAGGYP
ncbi:flagellar biosynthetic protein FliR [Fluviicoccus keumensis]|uniref:Flagellar biosynthetic protein FliR n=1 Tax=Fluviicoccus keumensis TaxID=1435465 RepID=A0A4Q7YNR7_9GAMM|nr:flagellar biosynthetic protein FliR [Fluviicoccus keumensis]RZU38513.1 flagellar biosynthetic protein FliR [Fluviicoccus keumensis]